MSLNYCSQCGVTIPEEQSQCSMCAGDVNHGTDGYYQAYLKYQEEEEKEEQDANTTSD